MTQFPYRKADALPSTDERRSGSGIHTIPPMPISSLMQLSTPHAVVDGARMQANIARVADYARDHKLLVRPHVKTHKDPLIAELQLEAGAIGVTVATAREAEVMAEVTDNILVAYPPVDQGRIDRLLALSDDVELTVALDSQEALLRLQRSWVERKRNHNPKPIKILVELDLGGRRTGVSSAEEVLELAKFADSGDGTSFFGLMVHPGNIRRPMHDPATRLALASVSDSAEAELATLRARLTFVIDELAAHGFSCDVVSGGNTPTLFSSHLIPELSEIRPGTYVYCDRDIASQGVFGWSDCAYSVLATVVSTAVEGQAVIDAGTKAIAKESLPGLEGYGALLDRPEVIVKSMSEEHGILDLSRTTWQPHVGDRVRIVPNHVCVSVHLQDEIAVVETGSLTLHQVAARGR